MHYGFKMRLQPGDIAINPSAISDYKDDFEAKKTNLKKYALKDGVSLDADLIAKHLFPLRHCDVFISHSFNDQKMAIQLAKNLKKNNIVAFVDSMFWGSAYDLLLAIDNKYSKPEGEKNYNYGRRNRSTAHVHMILTSALQQMIMNSSMLLFLDTESSISTEHSVKEEKKTSSPWVHMELMFSHLIWQIQGDQSMLDSSNEAYASDSGTPIFHKAPTKHLKDVTYPNLLSWLSRYSRIGNDQSFSDVAKRLYLNPTRVL